MKWDCGPDAYEKYSRSLKWHRWFAWFPVRVASHDCRWLEYIERKEEYGYDGLSYDYRPIGKV